MHQLRVCSAACICISIFVYVRGSWNSSQTCLSCSWNKTQTRFCLTLNSFPKSRLFANINVFELFDLPKSRLKLIVTNTRFASFLSWIWVTGKKRISLPHLFCLKFDNYPSIFGGSPSARERITVLIREIVYDYLTVCDYNPPTLRTDRETDGRTDDIR